jgi:type IX secretion system PorP/SprF family membrane protein
MRKHLFIVISICFFGNNLLAQDPQFSQFYANPLYTNPAFAGASGNYRFILNARDQYTALQNNYKTVSGSFDFNIPQLGGGLGAIATSDVSGDGQLTTTSLGAVYSYQIQITQGFSMRAGIQGSYVQKSYDFSKFQFGDQIDDRYGFVNKTAEKVSSQHIGFPNFAAGILAYTTIFYGGVAVHNITEPNQSFYFPKSSSTQYALPRRYTAHAGMNIDLTNERDEFERLTVSPNIIYMSQRDYNQINLGFYVRKQTITSGLWFRQTSQNTDALILLFGVRYPRWRAGYSYDVTVSGAKTATIGSHELSLAFEITPKKQTKRIFKPLVCPVF